jgi:hypothetical protein
MSEEHYSRQPQRNETSEIGVLLGDCWAKTSITKLLFLAAPNHRCLRGYLDMRRQVRRHVIEVMKIRYV